MFLSQISGVLMIFHDYCSCPTHIVLAYYSNLLTSRRAPQLSFRIAISDFCVCALVFSLLALVGVSVGFSSDFIAVE